VFAVARGVKLLASGELSDVELGRIHRQLLEAYVALDAVGQAVESCTKWRKYDRSARLDPVFLSPKIMDACARAPSPETAPKAPAPGSPTQDTTTQGTTTPGAATQGATTEGTPTEVRRAPQ
jgi:hypothetical protein